MGRHVVPGHRDRSSFIFPGQRDDGTSSKSCQGTGRACLSKPVKIWEGMRNGTLPDFDNLYKTEKVCSKTEKDVLKQERMF